MDDYRSTPNQRSVAALPARLRALRRKAGLSQLDVKERTGVSNVHLSKIEGGKHLPALGILVKLADAYGVQLMELFKLELTLEAEVTLRDFLSSPLVQAKITPEEVSELRDAGGSAFAERAPDRHDWERLYLALQETDPAKAAEALALI